MAKANTPYYSGQEGAKEEGSKAAEGDPRGKLLVIAMMFFSE